MSLLVPIDLEKMAAHPFFICEDDETMKNSEKIV